MTKYWCVDLYNKQGSQVFIYHPGGHVNISKQVLSIYSHDFGCGSE